MTEIKFSARVVTQERFSIVVHTRARVPMNTYMTEGGVESGDAALVKNENDN